MPSNLPMQPVLSKAFSRAEKPGQPIASLIATKSSAAITNSPVKVDVNISTGAGNVNRVAYYVDDILWESTESMKPLR